MIIFDLGKLLFRKLLKTTRSEAFCPEFEPKALTTCSFSKTIKLTLPRAKIDRRSIFVRKIRNLFESFEKVSPS